MIGSGSRTMGRTPARTLAATVAVGLLGALGALFALGAGDVHAQQAAQPAKVDPVRGQQIASQVCAACHGADGNSAAPANPKLAAQHAEYTYKQLLNFVPADGKPPTRPNPIMMGFASQLSDQDKRDVAAFYAGQALKPSVARNKDLVQLGQRIYRAGIADKGVPACAACHGPTGSGIPAQYARVGGQFAEYTEAQMVAFRSGQRHNNAQMNAIAARMSDQEIKAVSDYIAGLR
jgi:cytochrome c553